MVVIVTLNRILGIAERSVFGELFKVQINNLYFYKGEMYRYINEKGEMKQNEFKDDVFKTLGNFALNEAYSFYDYKTGVKNDRR